MFLNWHQVIWVWGDFRSSYWFLNFSLLDGYGFWCLFLLFICFCFCFLFACFGSGLVFFFPPLFLFPLSSSDLCNLNLTAISSGSGGWSTGSYLAFSLAEGTYGSWGWGIVMRRRIEMEDDVKRHLESEGGSLVATYLELLLLHGLWSSRVSLSKFSYLFFWHEWSVFLAGIACTCSSNWHGLHLFSQ